MKRKSPKSIAYCRSQLLGSVLQEPLLLGALLFAPAVVIASLALDAAAEPPQKDGVISSLSGERKPPADAISAPKGTKLEPQDSEMYTGPAGTGKKPPAEGGGEILTAPQDSGLPKGDSEIITSPGKQPPQNADMITGPSGERKPPPDAISAPSGTPTPIPNAISAPKAAKGPKS